MDRISRYSQIFGGGHFLWPQDYVTFMTLCLFAYEVVLLTLLSIGLQLVLRWFAAKCKEAFFVRDGQAEGGLIIMDTALVDFGEERAETQGEVPYLPVHLCPNPHLWPGAMGSD